MRLVRVAVPIPKDEGYVYAFPDGQTPEPGLRVLVPLGRRRVWGTVLETVAEAPRGVTVRPIAGVHEPRIALTEELIALCRWIAGYYAASLGEVLGAAAPSVTARKSRAAILPLDDVPWQAADPPSRDALNADQKAALAAIEASLGRGAFETLLLYGVTGSGKTAVYLHAALAAIRSGGQVMALVPEINLAPQALDAFRRAGVTRAALYHSELRPR